MNQNPAPPHSADAKKIIVYGCYGYTGELIVEEGVRKGLPLKLSGRNAEKVAEMAKRFDLPWAAADLLDDASLDRLLVDAAVVIHCSGPFIRTWREMADACLRNGVHYVDITGEIAVFEALHGYDQKAKEKGIQIMPGVGFDVVPTDCLAAFLKSQMPDATHLDLVIFSIGASTSRGTTLTMVENLGESGCVRRNGKIIPQAVAAEKITVDFGRGEKTGVSLPWGDVSTAYYSTGIPNITTYFVLPNSAIRYLKMSNWMGWILRNSWLKNIIRGRVRSGAPGPTQEARANSKTMLYGRVKNTAGKQVEKHAEVSNGYTFTAEAAVHIAAKIASGNFKPGFQTPSMAYGYPLLGEIMDKKGILA